MKKPSFLIFIFSFFILSSCGGAKISSGEDFTHWVDQYIGTGGHGHVFMGANVPFGAVQLGPTSIPQTWDWTSGYHISDTTIIGFSHTHLSGTGIGDLSDILFMPTAEQVAHARGTVEGGYGSGAWSYFSRANEFCAPGYYATKLDRYGVDVELTATKRVGFHKYTYPKGSKSARVLINLEDGQAWDEPIESFIRVVGDRVIEGYRISKGWAGHLDDEAQGDLRLPGYQRIYFVAEFSHPFYDAQIFDKERGVNISEFTSSKLYAELFFDSEISGARRPGGQDFQGEPLMVKVAVSPVSIKNAHENMLEELPGWDFAQKTAEAKKAWNDELGKIKIETDDEATKRIFYTAMYHSMIAPSVFCDVNGDYRGADGTTYEGADFTNYTTFSLWDTYRAAHPLMTIIHPEKVPDIVNTMLNIFEQQGKLPVWHLMGCETNCMVGNPAISVVADAVLKGFDGFDKELAYRAMRTSAMLDERGMDLYKQYGYIPYGHHLPDGSYLESVAVALEYAVADWSLAQVALKNGNTEDYDYFLNRSKAYRHYFDASTGTLRPLSADGKWLVPFDPAISTHRTNDYTEGNALQYTWLVPHDIEGLAECFGGVDKLHARLDSLFVADVDMGGDASPDISGLIGQYAHGNEPGHATIYLYSMTGEPRKTAELVRRVLAEMYRDQPDGLAGNEDVGQMSSWYILSAMGLYQPEPAGGRYYFGSPVIDKATINVGGGKTFTIEVENNSLQNKYIASVELNGKEYDKPYIDFADIARGGTLTFTMTND